MYGKWMSGRRYQGVKSKEHHLLGGHADICSAWSAVATGVTWPIGRIKGRVLGQYCHSRKGLLHAHWVIPGCSLLRGSILLNNAKLQKTGWNRSSL